MKTTLLVARGHSQKDGVDESRTFSHIPSLSSTRLVVAATLELELDLLHFDAERAFEESKLDTEIYLRI